MALGEVVAAVTGGPLDRATADLVTGPLAMTATGFNPPGHPTLRRHRSHHRQYSGDSVAWSGTVHDENARLIGGVAGHAACSRPRPTCPGSGPGGSATPTPRSRPRYAAPPPPARQRGRGDQPQRNRRRYAHDGQPGLRLGLPGRRLRHPRRSLAAPGRLAHRVHRHQPGPGPGQRAVAGPADECRASWPRRPAVQALRRAVHAAVTATPP